MHIITGMHRSGTSFISQALSRLGADFGPKETLFPADMWNQKGYFENIQVVDLNNRLILGDRATVDYWVDAKETGVARAFNSIAAGKWKYFLEPSQDTITSRGKKYHEQIVEVHHKTHGLFVKDPRFCVTLKPWVHGGEIESLVFSFRNPWAVAKSIKRREGLPLFFGYRQWMYHVRTFWETLPEGIPVFLVNFDRFFVEGTQSAAFERLARYMGHEAGYIDEANVLSALDIRLRHHEDRQSQMPPAVESAYNALLALEAEGGDQAIDPLDFETHVKAIVSK